MKEKLRTTIVVFSGTALSIATCLSVEAGNINLRPGFWYSNVGATQFESANSIDIADYCNDSDPQHVNGNSTACAQKWIDEARQNSNHLFASNGTYILTHSLEIFDGMHLQCESTDTIFQSAEDRWRYIFRTNSNIAPTTDILIEHCGFDVNGNPNNFASVVTAGNVEGMTFRGNRIFDSTGMRSEARDKQRQYLVVLDSSDILVEDNYFSDGGRIKVGRPGQRLVIRNNYLDFVNDNGITVVGTHRAPSHDGTNISEDILIYGNVIKDPTVAGIFFGSDGAAELDALTTRRVTIVNNYIMGEMAGACIRGPLSPTSGEIFIGSNVCIQSRPDVSADLFNSGIHLYGERAINITAFSNRIMTEDIFSLVNGAFLIAGIEVCLVDNQVTNSDLAAKYLNSSVISDSDNDWGIGRVQINRPSQGHVPVTVQTVPGIDSCYVPDFININ